MIGVVPCVVVVGQSGAGPADVPALLEGQPWQIVFARDARQAIELAVTRKADLVLLDTNAYSLDGIELCRMMRRDGRLSLLPIVLISGLDDVARRVAALEAGADDFLSRPIERSELVARVRSLLKIKLTRDRLEDAKQVILALANAAEAKDRFTVRHAERVARTACQLAARVGLSAALIEQIRVGALIHDVGKIAVPDHLLNKPGPLTPAEFDQVKRHTIVGAEIVAPLAGQPELVAIVRSHHERYDGGGYPDGLRGEEIPLSARIVAVCDAYDAMATLRPYRGAMPRYVVLETLKAGAGSQWDAELVENFIALKRGGHD